MPEISSFLNNVQLVVFVAMSAALAAMATGLWYERRQRMRNEKQVLDLKQEMLQHSHHDQLTGLPNRKFLLDVLPLRLKESNPFAFLYIKFPRAAEVRSSLGHDISDELTIAIVRRLKEVMDAQHFLARLSASSFAILYPADNPDMAMDKAQQIQRVLAKPYMLSGQEIQMISAIGVRHTNGGGDAMNVLRDAEIAMQNVQHKHIDAISVFESSMRAQLEMRYELETDLRRALYFETGQMKVAFQPIVSIKDEK
ncbi:MAG: GGDEF domain-containing protein, partial [Alphaproteobacteria bacterium]|nr:GGDEF domain-containing protein [Alphaproteobacteria bacterium]